MTSEFDEFASDYRRMVADPMRDWFAASPNFFARRKLELIIKVLRRMGVEVRGMHWLDVGCGQGDLLRLGREMFAVAAGCDPSAAMLSECQDLCVRVQPSDDTIPFPDRSFDVVTQVCVLHHVGDDVRSALIRESARVLRPHGWLCVIEHNPINPFTQCIVRRAPVDKCARLLKVGATKELLERYRFRDTSVYYFLVVPERLYDWVGGLEELFSKLPFGGQYAVFGRMPESDGQ